MKLNSRTGTNDPPGRTPSKPKRSHRSRRVLASFPIAAALLTAALLAGCAGSSNGSDSVAHINSSTSASKSSASDSDASLEVKLLRFAQCMRAHGDPSYPAPVVAADGQPHLSGAPSQTPQFLAAKEACYKYTPAGSATPAQRATSLAEAVKFAKCMQSHREPNFPDPTSTDAFNLPADLDTNSPQFKAAQKTCQHLDPTLQFQVAGGAGSPGSGS